MPFGGTRQAQDRVFQVLDGTIFEEAVAAGAAHLLPASKSTKPDLLSSAIAFDTNAILRLAINNAVDVIDYVGAKHEGPLLVPLQTMTEVWNNTDAFWNDLKGQLKDPLKKLKAIVDSASPIRLGPDLPNLIAEITEGKWDPGPHPVDELPESLTQIMKIFVDRGRSSSVSRSRFYSLGLARQSSRTPPGFMDQRLGDYFVWADLLMALVTETATFTDVILVTDDKKKDWYNGNSAHPYLVAEVQQLVSKQLYLMTVQEFKKATQTRSS